MKFTELEELVIKDLAVQLDLEATTGATEWPAHLIDYLVRVRFAVKIARELLTEEDRAFVEMGALEVPHHLLLDRARTMFRGMF